MEDNFLMFEGKKYNLVLATTNDVVAGEPVAEVAPEAPVEVAPEAPVAPVEGEVKE